MPDAFWNQTPRLVRAALRGVQAREKRLHQNAIVEARWSGLFSQAHPKEHERLLKAALNDRKPPRPMTGAEIGGAMRAWTKATAGR